jgi:uncharacterized membrane protein YbhN (UPF0104 family)
METVTINEHTEPRMRWRRLVSLAARLLMSAIVLFLVCSFVQWRNIIAAYHSADGSAIAAAALLLFFNIGARTLKWRVMLQSVKETPTLLESFGSVMLGISLGSFTPGEIGEFAGRALHITEARRSYIVGLTLLDKIQVALVTACAGLVSLAYIVIPNLWLKILLTLLIVLVSGIFIFRLERVARMIEHLPGSMLQKSWVKNIIEGFNLLRPRQVITTVCYTLAYFIVLILQMYCLVNAFSHLRFINAFIGTSAMMFVKSLLPISLGDLGIREAGSIYFFSLYDIPQADALNASLMLFFINIVVPSIVGVFFIRHQRISIHKLKQFWKNIRQLSHD